MPSVPERSRIWPLLAGALLVLGLPWSGPAVADAAPGDEPRRPDLDQARSSSIPTSTAPRFTRGLSGIESQFESIAVFQRVATARGADSNVMFDEVAEEIRQGVKRATRRALRDSVFEAISLDAKLDALRGRQPAPGDAGGGPGPAHRFDFGVGIHSFEPEVDMKYRLDGGQLKVTLGVHGNVAVRFRGGDSRRADVGIAFDGEDTCGFSFRLGF